METTPASRISLMLRKLFTIDGHLDWKIAVLTVVSTLVILVERYNQLTKWETLDRFLLFFILPMAIILFVFKENPREYGFQLGDWRMGLLLTAGSIALIAPVLYFLARSDSSMKSYYDWQLKLLPWDMMVELFAWEFLFRGWLLFGYARKFGAEAIWLQAVPFALAHIGKPEVETLSTIFGGFVFGWIAYRTRSFLYPFIIHFFVSSFTIIVAAGILG
jgi:membrane protease YdiL (CAAX protease family)